MAVMPYDNVAGVVKRLTRRIVAPLCVGSSPTTRPIFFTQKREREMSRAYTDGGKPPYGGIAKW